MTMDDRRAILDLVMKEFQRGRHPKLVLDFVWKENEEVPKVIVYRENTEEFPEDQRAGVFVWLNDAFGRASAIHPVWLSVEAYVPNIKKD